MLIYIYLTAIYCLVLYMYLTAMHSMLLYINIIAIRYTECVTANIYLNAMFVCNYITI